MKLKTGKDEIVYLLAKVIARYEADTGQGIKLNTNRKNYEDLARVLSEISNRLPETSETLGHDNYPPDENKNNTEYPLHKYDITGGQVKDAINGIVSKPRPFLVDACYIYLFGMGRKAFAKKPTDPNLLDETVPVVVENTKQEMKPAVAAKGRRYLLAGFIVVFIVMVVALFNWLAVKKQLDTTKQDLGIVPYKVSPAEIDSLAGIWLCYTGSPQARSYDPGRYHKIVSNITDVKYKDGYFTFKRYGSNFDHIGYMQYESPWLVSIHSRVENGKDSIESPKLSLMRLGEQKQLVSVISASWNFDEGNKNRIIGIREVFIKQGSGGQVEEVINTPENAGCSCKIIKWHKTDGATQTFYLKNELLDTIRDERLKSLLDEKSILLREPADANLLLGDSSAKAQKF